MIDLESNRLNELGKAMGSLKKLRYLYASKNNISELTPEIFSLSLCHTLKAMRLAYNSFTRYPSATLSMCKQLSHLDLGYNRIEDISASEMAGTCDNLDTLVLKGNRISLLPPHLFRSCQRLRELSLSYNRISAIDVEAFKDVGNTLESLEISFGLKMVAFPGQAFRPLIKLLWLALDNNELEVIRETDLYSLGELQYLNLESNRLASIPKHMLHKNVHKKLLDVRLSYNRLRVVDSGTFSSLNTLQTVTAIGNQLMTIERLAFVDLPNLVAVLLSDNQISSISQRAFSKLTSLQRLDLQYNSLRQFSLASFENCSKVLMSPMTLNVSHNEIRDLTPAPAAKNHVPPFIHVIDASHNRLRKMPRLFLEQVAPALRNLDLSYNRIEGVDNDALKALVSLQVLRLSANNIIDLHSAALRHLTGLQILDLSRNRIEVLQFKLFAGLSGLRIVDLSHNR